MPSEGKFQQKAFAPLVLPAKGIGWLQPLSVNGRHFPPDEPI